MSAEQETVVPGVREMVAEDPRVDFDADAVARAFRAAYDDYPFEDYTVAERFKRNVVPDEGSINLVSEVGMNELERLIKGSERGTEILPFNDDRVDELEGFDDVEEFLGERDTLRTGTASLKIHEGGREYEMGGAVVFPSLQGIKGADLYQEMADERYRRAYQEGASRLVTDAVSSEHAITQWENFKRGMRPEGVSVNKYPEVVAGEGRETVIPMVDSYGDFDYTGSDQREVYVTDDTAPLVEQVVSSMNRVRSDPEATNFDHPRVSGPMKKLNRSYELKPEGPLQDHGFTVKEKMYSERDRENPEKDGVGMAKYQVIPGGDNSLNEVMEQLEHAQGNDELDWVGVEIDANHESAWTLSDYITAADFDLEKYSPEKLSYHDEGPRDALGFQYSETGTGCIEMIDDVVDTAEVAGLEPETANDTGVEHTQHAYL